MTLSLPRGIRNNNPGNLNFVGQKGAHREPGPNGRFAVFPTAEDGLRALRDQLIRYYHRDGLTSVAAMIGKWAPPSDGNDTSAYARTVAARLHIGVHDALPALTPARLATLIHAIISVENGQDPYGKTVEAIVHDRMTA